MGHAVCGGTATATGGAEGVAGGIDWRGTDEMHADIMTAAHRTTHETSGRRESPGL